LRCVDPPESGDVPDETLSGKLVTGHCSLDVSRSKPLGPGASHVPTQSPIHALSGERARGPSPTQVRAGVALAVAQVRSPRTVSFAEPTGAGAGAANEAPSLEEVYRGHAARVSRWAGRLAGPGSDVEDIVHDVFLVVQRRLAQFRGEALLSTWLYEITVRVVQSRRRSQRRQSRWLWPWSRAGVWADGADCGDIDFPSADPHASPLEALERQQASQLHYRLLDGLDEKYRTAVVLFELEGLSCQDIAVITCTSVSNVWARVSRGREKLIKAFAASSAPRAPEHAPRTGGRTPP
jgi:RNA polymerase sigma-70 factor (ECF subfamily)